MTTLSPDRAAPAVAGQLRGAMLRRAEERIQGVLDDESARWSAINSRGRIPVDAVRALVEAGGKRLRPAFCLTGFLAAGGDPAEELAVDAAAGLEFLHAFALIHDDVMDDSRLRRGVPTVHTRHSAEHAVQGWRGEARRYGESVAILTGDLAYSYAERLTGGLPPAARRVWTDLITEMIIGQFLDMTVAAESMVDPELSRYIAVGKSGAYSIHRPLVLGAAIAGRDDLGPAFEEYGTALGEAFQLRDDLIDGYGDAEAAGKPTGHDLEQHKMTLLLALAAESDDRVRAMVSGGTWDSVALRNRLDECGIRDAMEKRIDALVNTAREAVSRIAVPPLWRDELIAMADQVAYRDR